jgi:hypothetical protein
LEKIKELNAHDETQKLKPGVYDMRKVTAIGTLLTLVTNSIKKPYMLSPEAKIHEFLTALPFVDHEHCLAASLVVEPEEKEKEKDKDKETKDKDGKEEMKDSKEASAGADSKLDSKSDTSKNRYSSARRMLGGRSSTADGPPPKITEIQKMMARQKAQGTLQALPRSIGAEAEKAEVAAATEDDDQLGEKFEDLDDSMETCLTRSLARRKKFVKFLEVERNQGLLEFWEIARKFQDSYPKLYVDMENLVKTYIVDKSPKRIFLDKNAQETILSEFAPMEKKIQHLRNVQKGKAAAMRITGFPRPSEKDEEEKERDEDIESTLWEGDPYVLYEAITWVTNKLQGSYSKFQESLASPLQDEVDKAGIVEWFTSATKKNDGGMWRRRREGRGESGEKGGEDRGEGRRTGRAGSTRRTGSTKTKLKIFLLNFENFSKFFSGVVVVFFNEDKLSRSYLREWNRLVDKAASQKVEVFGVYAPTDSVGGGGESSEAIPTVSLSPEVESKPSGIGALFRKAELRRKETRRKSEAMAESRSASASPSITRNSPNSPKESGKDTPIIVTAIPEGDGEEEDKEDKGKGKGKGKKEGDKKEGEEDKEDKGKGKGKGKKEGDKKEGEEDKEDKGKGKGKGKKEGDKKEGDGDKEDKEDKGKGKGKGKKEGDKKEGEEDKEDKGKGKGKGKKEGDADKEEKGKGKKEGEGDKEEKGKGKKEGDKKEGEEDKGKSKGRGKKEGDKKEGDKKEGDKKEGETKDEDKGKEGEGKGKNKGKGKDKEEDKGKDAEDKGKDPEDKGKDPEKKDSEDKEPEKKDSEDKEGGGGDAEPTLPAKPAAKDLNARWDIDLPLVCDPQLKLLRYLRNVMVPGKIFPGVVIQVGKKVLFKWSFNPKGPANAFPDPVDVWSSLISPKQNFSVCFFFFLGHLPLRLPCSP